MKPLTPIGTPRSPSATRVMLLGAGELGKEVLIALQRLGVETIAVDRYANAPGHQVAHRAHVVAIKHATDLGTSALLQHALAEFLERGYLRAHVRRASAAYRARRDVLSVHPRGDTSRPEQGVFSTRSPDRPNPIGLHRVTVTAIEGERLQVGALEALDGTPILDIKSVPAEAVAER